MSQPYSESPPRSFGRSPREPAPAPQRDLDIRSDKLVTISLIGDTHFEREVLASSLRGAFSNASVVCYGTTSEWAAAKRPTHGAETVLYHIGDRSMSDDATKEELRQFIEGAQHPQVIVISRKEDAVAVFDAIECGAASYIPSSAGPTELVEAIRLSSSNSVVIPRSSLIALRGDIGRPKRTGSGLERYFTERQLTVALALQRGAANKTIAYELGLCESTVKVHIRNIMRKL